MSLRYYLCISNAENGLLDIDRALEVPEAGRRTMVGLAG